MCWGDILGESTIQMQNGKRTVPKKSAQKRFSVSFIKRMNRIAANRM